MLSRIADRLMRVRARQMVGRAVELDLLATALDAAELPYLLLHISGPNGIGKTTLLRAYAQLAEARNIPCTLLDVRNFDPTPEGLVHSLGAALGLAPEVEPMRYLARLEGRRVLLVDTYEEFEPNEDWLREVFLPQLTADTLVVLASANPLSLTWRTDPGWREILRVVALRNLSVEDSLEYLTSRGVPRPFQQPALDFTHGYPLALSLVADMVAQADEETGLLDFTPENSPHIIQALLDKFVDKAPTPAHRAALEICALVRLTTEPLLAEMLEGTAGVGARDAAQSTAHELFRWLRGLSFMESSLFGLYPHETAREALLADLRWRNRERYNELHRRARYYYNARLDSTQGMEQQRVLFDYFFLHRDNPIVRSAFDWRESVAMRVDAMHEEDYSALVEMVHRFEGSESAELAAYWLKLQPESVIVFRERGAVGCEPPHGFLFQLALHKTTPEQRERDPAIQKAWDHLNAMAPLRPGEVATHFRFWMARDSYHAVSPVQSLIIVHMVRHYLTTRNLAHTFFPVGNPERWGPMFQYAEIARIPEADFTVGGRTYSIFGNDWRRVPTITWLERLADKETVTGAIENTPLATHDSAGTVQLVVLSEEDFALAVRDALRHLNEPDLLKVNPLARSRLVAERGKPEAASALRQLIVEVIGTLQNAPRLSRCYRPLHYTYVQPAPSQERAAEILDLPFSTYRRHLTEGITEVARLLWLREIGDIVTGSEKG